MPHSATLMVIDRPICRLAPIALAFLLLLTACSGESADLPSAEARSSTGAAVPAELPEGLQTRLDSANIAFRAGDLDGALDHFTVVTNDEPGLAAGWYGLGMTLRALGDTVAADSAMMRVHELAPELPLEHPTQGAPANPHPNPHANPPVPDLDSTDGATR